MRDLCRTTITLVILVSSSAALVEDEVIEMNEIRNNDEHGGVVSSHIAPNSEDSDSVIQHVDELLDIMAKLAHSKEQDSFEASSADFQDDYNTTANLEDDDGSELEIPNMGATQRKRGSISIMTKSQSTQVQPVATNVTAILAVIPLNRHTFQQNVLNLQNKQTENWIVRFCYDWYEPCQDFTQAYTDLASQFQQELNMNDVVRTTVRFADVDCGLDRILCNDQKVNHYPMVVHYARSVKAATWNGGAIATTNRQRLEKWIWKREGLTIDRQPVPADGAGVAKSPSQVVATGIGLAVLFGLHICRIVLESSKGLVGHHTVAEPPLSVQAMLPTSWLEAAADHVTGEL